MKIALLYPPPWKIPLPDEVLPFAAEGPPAEYAEGDLDADFYQLPYGLLTLGSEAIERGHQVKIFNLSSWAWTRVEEVIQELDADVFGMSCWTANRRGVAYLSELIKKLHPQATTIIGGPHATPFAVQLLERHAGIDLVARGESEDTFLEVLDRLQNGIDLAGIPGTAFRVGDEVRLAESRSAIRKLDVLTSPQRYFSTHILMTSRGCPWQCTFCGAETTWGRGFRGHSVEYVVDAIEAA
ncbi:MAG: B12-binding domain-containing radical SAM protein [Polyangiaceae bacterium]|nr:B12-binding domain-containing radical SAM protein [Polyangiaceae bacterium]